MADLTDRKDLLTNGGADSNNDCEYMLGVIEEDLKQILDSVIELIKVVIETVQRILEDLWNAVLISVSNPKWVHYYKHGKRWRTRKKYYDRMRKAFFINCGKFAEKALDKI